ncbi:DNA-binding protein [Bacteroides sp. AN502(2024)]|uniref:HU family DNA-binding protein n=1 Tax=Bacteroides sp. AN502(2024) TaxID=3160599 RepID=UPI0035167199
MSILIKPVQRKNPQKQDEAPKWYPVQSTVKLVDENEVAELLSDETTLNPMEAAMAIRQLGKIIRRLLLDSKSVRLGNWATLSVTLSSEGSDTKDALTVRNIKSINTNFQPSADLHADLQKADFVWLDKIMKGQDSSDGGNTGSEPEEPDGGGDGGGEAPDPVT